MGFKDYSYWDKEIAQYKVRQEGLILRLKAECEEIQKRAYDVSTTALCKVEAIIAELYEVEDAMARTRNLKMAQAEAPLRKDEYDE